VRIQALKELHSLSKTYTLLIKDIPFVTNISKDYDKEVLDTNYNDITYKKGTYPNNVNKNNQTLVDNKTIIKINSSRIVDPGNQFYFDDLKDSHITDTINSLNGLSNQDKLSKALQGQLNYDTGNNTRSE
jgi:hypothetical protein